MQAETCFCRVVSSEHAYLVCCFCLTVSIPQHCSSNQMKASCAFVSNRLQQQSTSHRAAAMLYLTRTTSHCTHKGGRHRCMTCRCFCQTAFSFATLQFTANLVVGSPISDSIKAVDFCAIPVLPYMLMCLPARTNSPLICLWPIWQRQAFLRQQAKLTRLC